MAFDLGGAGLMRSTWSGKEARSYKLFLFFSELGGAEAARWSEEILIEVVVSFDLVSVLRGRFFVGGV